MRTGKRWPELVLRANRYSATRRGAAAACSSRGRVRRPAFPAIDTDIIAGRSFRTRRSSRKYPITQSGWPPLAGNLGGLTLPPGLYKSTSSLSISSGDLTLDAQGDPNAVFILQMASTLTTTSGRAVILSGGAKASNVFWQVGSSATLGTTSAFVGTIMADQSITLDTGATLSGRALARIGAVTLAANTVVRPTP